MLNTEPLTAQLLLANLLKVAFATGILHLGKASAVIGPNTKVADFTEADFSGYEAVTFTVANMPYIDAGGGANFSLPSTQFDLIPPVLPAPIVANDVWNWWITNAAGAILACGQWANPIPMAIAGNSIPFQLFINSFNPPVVLVDSNGYV